MTDPAITLSIISCVGILIGAIAYVIKNKLRFVKCFCCKSDCRQKPSADSPVTPDTPVHQVHQVHPKVNISEV